VGGMVSATSKRNTVRDSKMVTPGKEHIDFEHWYSRADMHIPYKIIILY
jgi:hypothetical protein